MNKFIKLIAVVWAIIIFAFFLVNGFKWIDQWDESYRVALLIVLLLNLTVTSISNYADNK